jgi:hypothetical protein
MSQGGSGGRAAALSALAALASGQQPNPDAALGGAAGACLNVLLEQAIAAQQVPQQGANAGFVAHSGGLRQLHAALPGAGAAAAANAGGGAGALMSSDLYQALPQLMQQLQAQAQAAYGASALPLAGAMATAPAAAVAPVLAGALGAQAALPPAGLPLLEQAMWLQQGQPTQAMPQSVQQLQQAMEAASALGLLSAVAADAAGDDDGAHEAVQSSGMVGGSRVGR